jgi:DNA-binding Lrp family transcriptional regulator
VTWTFFSSHGHVLLYLDAHPDAPMREVAAAIGITERSAQRIISELVEAGYVSRERVGSRNHYTVHREVPLRHSQLVGHTVGDLLSGLDPKRRNASRGNSGGGR